MLHKIIWTKYIVFINKYKTVMSKTFDVLLDMRMYIR